MKKRQAYLDALRGIAILLMVVDHAYDWWLTKAGRAGIVGRLHGPLGAMAAPLFFSLAGVSMALSSQRAAQSGQPYGAFARRQIWRGFQLVLWGYALNLIIYSASRNLDDLWAVDVLHTLGLCIWCTLPLLWLPTPAAAGVALGMAAGITVLSQNAGGWPLPMWAAAILTGTGEIGYFPLLLWLPYTLLGLAVGRWIGATSKPGRLMGALSAIGLLALLGAARADPGWGYRHPRPIYVLFSVAVLFWLTAALWLWMERWGRRGPLVRALRDMGQASLPLYITHHLVGYWLFLLLGWTEGHSWHGEYGVFSPLWASILLCVLLATMLLTARGWLAWRTSRHTQRSVASDAENG